MRRFDDTGLWAALKAYDNSPATINERLDAVLEEFLDELQTYCREEGKIAERTRTLNIARSELAVFVESDSHGQKKYAPLRAAVKKAIYYIDSELTLIKMDLEHPDRFITFPDDPAPLARWNGKITELIEYYLLLQISGKLLLPSGKAMSYADLIRYLELSYGITIPGERDRKSEVLNRSKATVFIEKMLNVMKERIKELHQ